MGREYYATVYQTSDGDMVLIHTQDRNYLLTSEEAGNLRADIDAVIGSPAELARLQRIEAAARKLSEAAGDAGLISPELIKQLREALNG